MPSLRPIRDWQPTSTNKVLSQPPSRYSHEFVSTGISIKYDSQPGFFESVFQQDQRLVLLQRISAFSACYPDPMPQEHLERLWLVLLFSLCVFGRAILIFVNLSNLHVIIVL